jgi:hypothetical protein
MRKARVWSCAGSARWRADDPQGDERNPQRASHTAYRRVRPTGSLPDGIVRLMPHGNDQQPSLRTPCQVDEAVRILSPPIYNLTYCNLIKIEIVEINAEGNLVAKKTCLKKRLNCSLQF